MSDTATAPAADSKTSTPEQSFLSRLVDFGDEIIAAERPAIADVPKVLAGLIHWVDQGGGFVAPESFNPALSEAVAEQEAESARLAAANADMAKRLESLETLMRSQIAASGVVPAAPIAEQASPVGSGAAPSEGAAPVAPASAPVAPTTTEGGTDAAPVVPGVNLTTPPQGEPAPVAPPVDPVAPVAPPTVSE